MKARAFTNPSFDTLGREPVAREMRPPGDYGDLLHGLRALWPSYFAHAVTFLFIGQAWANHHVMFDHIRNVVWQYARRNRLIGESLDTAGATAIGQALPARPRVAHGRRVARRCLPGRRRGAIRRSTPSTGCRSPGREPAAASIE